MASNINNLAFDEAEGTLAVYLIDDPNTVSPIEAQQIDFHTAGAMVRTASVLHFVPYSNVAEIRQSV